MFLSRGLLECSDRVRCRLSPAEAPEDKPEATVGIQTDGHLTRGIQLTLQLDRATKGTGGGVGHLRVNEESETAKHS